MYRVAAGIDRGPQRGAGLLEGHGGVEAVHLPEVDVIGAEPVERGVQRGQQPAAAAADADRGGGQHHGIDRLTTSGTRVPRIDSASPSP